MILKIVIGSLLELCGLLLIIFRMQLLESMVGKFKIKLGLLLSVDKLHSAIFWITVIGGLLILAGAVIFFLAFYPMLKSNKLKDEQIQPQQ